jgi:hypothetical protein
MSYRLEPCGGERARTDLIAFFARWVNEMPKFAALKIVLVAIGCALLSTASLAVPSRGSHGSHGGGPHHGRGSHGGGHFHSSGSRSGGGRFRGSGHGAFSQGFSSAQRQGSSSGFYRGSGSSRGSFSPRQNGRSRVTRGASIGLNRPASGYSSSRLSSSRALSSGSSRGNESRSAASFGPNRPPNSQQASVNGPGRATSVSRKLPTSRANSSFDSNRQPSAQRNWAGVFARGQGFRGGASAARVLSLDSIRPGGQRSSASWTASPRRGSISVNETDPGFSSDSNQPASSRTPAVSASYRKSGANTPNLASNHRLSNAVSPGNTGFHNSSFRNSAPRNSGSRNSGSRNSSLSQFGRGRFADRRFEPTSIGFGGGDGDGFGAGASSLFGDLFGLALNFGRFALPAAWAFLGVNLLDSALQSFSWDAKSQPPNWEPCQDLYSPGNFACTQ